ncbi:2Fe-2S iron-sulfur cluster-binding protein [Streptomyces pseudovenezuelae]|uniref:2Fe-2S iron-sulfur cluster-binding protein n=1 Tax=Streptomyces pseudovenezuelae TaxID=67350 RepID=UPI0036E3CC63
MWEDPGELGGPLARRLDASAVRRLLAAVDARSGPDSTFALCGPPGLVATARHVLADIGADPPLVRGELFTTDGTLPRVPEPAGQAPRAGEHRVTALLDGRHRAVTVLPCDPVLLGTLPRSHPDVPYVCREGVCDSCRAKVVSGEVTADGRNALDERDRAVGCTLVCGDQPHPRRPGDTPPLCRGLHIRPARRPGGHRGRRLLRRERRRPLGDRSVERGAIALSR